MVGILCGIAYVATGFTIQGSQAYEVKTDKALSAPITLSLKYGAIDAVLKSISKQCGVDVETSGQMSSAKLTIFAKATPCNLILDQIATVLDGQWKNLSGIRFISYSPAVQKQQTDYLAAEDKVLRGRAEQDLEGIIKRVVAEEQAAQAQANQTPDVPPSPGASPLPGHPGRAALSMNRSMISDQIGKLLQNASESDLDSFWKGEFAAVEVGPDNNQRTALPGVRRRPQQQNLSSPTADPAMVYARYDLYGTHLLQIGSSRFPVVTQRFVVPSLLKPEDALAASPYGKAVLAWSHLDVDANDPLWNEHIEDAGGKVVGFGAAERRPTTPTGDESPVRTQSDLLERFFQLSNIPVVADGFRTSLPQTVADPKGSTAIAWLTALSASTGAFVKIQDGIADVRQGGFWRLKQYEVPEASIKAMEANAAKLTLLDYATFFAGLTRPQAEVFQSNTPPEVAFPTANLVDCIPALRLIGTLGTNFPVNGQPVPIGELGSDSQTLVGQAIADSVFSGRMWNKNEQGATPKVVCAVLKQKDVQQPEGTVTGMSLELVLPLGETVEYEIPLKLR